MISSRMDGFSFHPVIREWFQRRFRNPTDPQAQGWPHIAAGKHTLIAAPTGSGKTLTAFLAVIDRLFREAAEGNPADEVEDDEAEESLAAEPKPGIRVIYVSPLRALSNDMQKNLEQPLQEIYAEAAAQGLNVPPIRVGLRTGDTPSHKRAAIVKNPPQILVTTPESLYLMLTSERAREVLRSVDTLIVDEIHALVRDKRGSHLSLSVERLAALTNRPLQRIGLSATQKPIERMAEFLIGARPAETPPTEPLPCAIVDVGHQRELDLAIEVPPSELSAVCSHEQWAEVNARIVELINTHRSTLIFVNTRRMAERVTYQLTQLLGDEAVGSHHGSLAADIRLSTEQKLKNGELKAVVATASLELGIDVGYIDLVIQLGSPRSIATFLQRIGRSGHALGLVPKGRLFALTRDEVLECMGLIRAIRAGRLDVIPIPESPADVLAQQIVAEVAAREWSTDELFDLTRRAYPYRDLPREQFDKILTFLSEGLTTGAGRGTTLLHHDQVNRRLRSRAGSRINATTNGGAIPEVDQIRVVLDQEQTVVGSVDEEFGIESQAGDIFLLGNTSWRILALRGNDLIVGDAQGAPPTIPFWRGEAPGRTIELSEEISALREQLETRIREALPAAGLPSSDDETAAPWAPPAALVRWLVDETHCTPHAAGQMVEYVAAQQAAVGLVPTQTRVIFERFFDESGGMQLVVHAPFGSRINRAWGLAMRKRFCRSFDFELQATADDDGFILSLGPQHSFPIESLFPMMRTDNARNLLEQAILAVPMFQLRWRWNATRALQVSRMRNGKKVPPALQRFRSDDLLTAVFPKLTGCQENIVGDHEIPDHPLVQQTMEDCLHEALDLDGLLDVLGKVESGAITFVARDTREPSPFAYELLNSNPYAFLDGGEVQERRARTAQTRRSVSVESARDLGRLDPAAIAQVIEEARPLIRNADDLHDVLQSRIFVPLPELVSTLRSPPQLLAPIEWVPLADRLIEDGRAARVTLPSGLQGWTCAERWPALRAIFPEALAEPPLTAPASVRHDWTDVEARLTLIRGAMEIAGPVTAHELAGVMGLAENEVFACLEALEGEGIVLRGRFRNGSAYDPAGDPRATDVEWCHRRLLSRIHRKTVAGLRREIEPVDVPTFMRFLFQHQCVLPGARRKESTGAFDAIVQLQGMDIPAVAWERDILPARVENYRREWLDELCLTGEVGWTRLHPPGRDPEKARPMASLTRVAPISLFLREDLGWLMTGAEPCPRDSLSTPAQELVEHLERGGAMFATDLLSATRMLPAQLDDALGELVARGVVTSDGFSGLRALVREGSSESGAARTGPKVVRHRRASSTGRWTLVPTRLATEMPEPTPDERRTFVEEWAWQLLRRWGVVFKDLLTREQGTPAWWELVQHFRRLEARGEIRGGRFIQGVAGEQFALSDTVRTLRDLREAPAKGDAVSPAVAISAADPLNLVGILTDHARVPSTAGNRILYWHGRPVAHLIGGECTIYPDCPPEAIPIVRQRFELRVAGPAPSPVPLREDVPTPSPASDSAAPAQKPPAAEDQKDQKDQKNQKNQKKRAPARVLLRPASNQRMFPSGAPRPRFS
ncbi:DEAD/DEAH box helicase [Planctomyces sp. SH-PL14]|uniref:DEAD/DEAH box helicase n=1 Tax=Planctomyces sp. SH-PL14 TaxID=1632864 RepID=UPI0009466A99|nr:DEAD/DEAH box helicase [Planctomyces sp. SH-PL14]